MDTLITFFKDETRRFFSKRNTTLVLLLYFISLGLVQYGIFKYNNSQEQKDVFKNIEKKKNEQIPNFRIYGVVGFRVIFLPSPISILHINSSVLSDMSAIIDSAERLNIYESLKGKNTFSLTKNWLSDYSGIMLFFGGLLALFYGFESYSNRE